MPSQPTPTRATNAEGAEYHLVEHVCRFRSIRMDDETTRLVEDWRIWNMPDVSRLLNTFA